MDTLYTRKTLAAYLQCAPRTVDNLRSKGLPHIMVGDSPRFQLEPVLRWLDATRRADEAAADAFHAGRAADSAESEALGEAIRSYPDPHRV